MVKLINNLGERSLEYLSLMALGLSNDECCEKMNIAKTTGTSHRVMIYNALGVEGSNASLKAVLIYLEEKGLLKGECTNE